MEQLIDVINVRAMADYLLHLKFENGEERVFDMTPIWGKNRLFA